MLRLDRVGSCLVGMALGLAATASLAADKDRPAVLDALEAQGLTIIREFPVGGGLRGFAGIADQQPIAVYVAPDGNAIIGSRVGPDGAGLDDQALHDLVAKPMGDAIWSRLESSAWVLDGRADAPRIVYTFSDANCPYCHRFWEAARPWVDAGKVQLRHVIVGIIRADSSTKAAAILGAPDRTAALLQNERNYGRGGITPAASVPDDIRKVLDANAALMRDLGFQGTPGIIYRNDQGVADRVSGMPAPASLPIVLGPR